MQIKPGFMLKNVAGSHVVVPVGENSVNFNAMITLNESGAFLWEKLAEEQTEDQLVAALTLEYEADEATARRDINKFIETIKGAGLII